MYSSLFITVFLTSIITIALAGLLLGYILISFHLIPDSEE